MDMLYQVSRDSHSSRLVSFCDYLLESKHRFVVDATGEETAGTNGRHVIVARKSIIRVYAASLPFSFTTGNLKSNTRTTRRQYKNE